MTNEVKLWQRRAGLLSEGEYMDSMEEGVTVKDPKDLQNILQAIQRAYGAQLADDQITDDIKNYTIGQIKQDWINSKKSMQEAETEADATPIQATAAGGDDESKSAGQPGSPDKSALAGTTSAATSPQALGDKLIKVGNLLKQKTLEKGGEKVDMQSAEIAQLDQLIDIVLNAAGGESNTGPLIRQLTSFAQSKLQPKK